MNDIELIRRSAILKYVSIRHNTSFLNYQAWFVYLSEPQTNSEFSDWDNDIVYCGYHITLFISVPHK